MKYLEKCKEDSNNLKEILYRLSKARKNSGKNEKNVTRFYKNTSMITLILGIRPQKGCTVIRVVSYFYRQEFLIKVFVSGLILKSVENQFEKILNGESTLKMLKLEPGVEVSIANYQFKFQKFWPIFAI